LVAGTTYQFQVRARNVYGYGGFSLTASAPAIDYPAKMAIPTVTVSGTNVVVAWTLPATHGSSIVSYDIRFKKSDGSFAQETTSCDGTSPAIVAARTCTVPMATLKTLTGKAIDSLIVVKISAENARGDGDYSEVNTSGATIEAEASQVGAPSFDAATSTNT
jgi:hypothetical protein